jgi:DNA-3-methyladenine glycosylase II
LKIKERIKILTYCFYGFIGSEFRSIGVSRQKTSYIKALAVLSKNIDLESLVNKTPSSKEELIKIKGIGNWTIDVYLMFCLQALICFRWEMLQ